MALTAVQWRSRILTGGVLGMGVYLLIAFLAQPGALLGGSLGPAFTFCFNPRVPQALGAGLGLALWFALGAEVGVATLPFAQSGRALAGRSLAHFLIMAATLSGWVCLNFRAAELPGFLALLGAVYLLIWLGRWVGWYAEAAAMRRKLGLPAAPSPLKGRQTLPYVFFALGLCLALPLVMAALDAPDVPVLRGLVYPWLLLPVGCFFSGLSLGRRHGICPLYPPACALALLPAVLLVYNPTALPFCATAFSASLLGNLTGAALRRGAGKRPPADAL